MPESKSTKKAPASSPDRLAKPTKPGIELSESALDRASGGAVFPSSPAANNLKIDLKIDSLAAPSPTRIAVKPGN
jgi:hypothetical protein